MANMSSLTYESFIEAAKKLESIPYPAVEFTIDNIPFHPLSFSIMMGMRMIESSACYSTKRVVRGIADSRRPNNKKPIYRTVTIHIPYMCIIAGNLYYHPSLKTKLMKQLNVSLI